MGKFLLYLLAIILGFGLAYCVSFGATKTNTELPVLQARYDSLSKEVDVWRVAQNQFITDALVLKAKYDALKYANTKLTQNFVLAKDSLRKVPIAQLLELFNSKDSTCKKLVIMTDSCRVLEINIKVLEGEQNKLLLTNTIDQVGVLEQRIATSDTLFRLKSLECAKVYQMDSISNLKSEAYRKMYEDTLSKYKRERKLWFTGGGIVAIGALILFI